MKRTDSIFLLRSELINTMGNNVDHYSFERLLNVRYLRDSGRNATIYEKQLGMYFHDASALSLIYEIETVDFLIKASSRLYKAEEYIRRINYRYDWIQLSVNKKGKVVSIDNKAELKERWPRLKAAILKDYTGDAVEYGLSEIDKQFNEPDGIDICVSQYFYFGLLFPCVPVKHKENWEYNRTIRFSDYENEIFEETITHIQTKDSRRYYEVTGKAFSDSRTVIDSYKGNLCVNENDIFPESADIKIKFERDDFVNQWSFDLLRYNGE